MKLLLRVKQGQYLSQEMNSLLHQVVKLSLWKSKDKRSAEVSLTLTDDEEIRRLNAKYRQIDRPTDVLSFPLQEGETLAALPKGRPMLGDIVISVPRARAQAEAYGHSFRRELAFLTAHGVLHLLGFDHETPEEAAVMEKQQYLILAALGLSRDKEARPTGDEQ